MLRFKILNHHTYKCPIWFVPWSFVENHEKQAMANHGGQTLKTLNDRGGLSPQELYATVHDMKYRDAEKIMPTEKDAIAWLLTLFPIEETPKS